MMTLDLHVGEHTIYKLASQIWSKPVAFASLPYIQIICARKHAPSTHTRYMARPLHIKPLPTPTMVDVDNRSRQPPVKAHQGPSQIAANMAGIRTDEEYDLYMAEQKQGGSTVMVQFGSTWCTKCHKFFPTFFELSKKYSSVKYAVAQVDYMKERAKGIRYSPTFSFFRNGRKVDEVLGKDAQKLEDHLWLHSEQVAPEKAQSLQR